MFDLISISTITVVLIWLNSSVQVSECDEGFDAKQWFL